MSGIFDIISPMDADQLKQYHLDYENAEWVSGSMPQDVATQSVDSPVYISTSATRVKIYLARIVVGILFVILFFRLGWLQLVQGDFYSFIALSNTERYLPIPASRGTVLDREGRALTINVPKFSLVMTPNDIPRDTKKREDMARVIAKLTGVSSSTISELLSTYAAYRFDSVTLLEDIPYETALRLDVIATDIPGISVVRGAKRKYVDPFSPENSSSTLLSLSHLIGYTGALSHDELSVLYNKGYLPSDTIGKLGIEKTQETLLRGSNGKKKISVDSIGKENQLLAIIPPVAGSHIRLTIDAAMQKQMEVLLSRQMRIIGARRASAVVMNPKNGEILALVSLPTFDNNDFSGGISSEKYASYLENKDTPLFNRAIAGTFPSGSTIKPLIATAALEEGIVTPQTKILSTGGLRIGQWFFPDWKVGGHGPTDLDLSLAWSVNTYYYTIGGGYGEREGLGIDKIRSYLQKFGFSTATGIDIVGEAKGFLPSKEWKKQQTGEQWYIGDTYNVSIGQGDILVTPLQITYSTGLIANNGTGYVPHLSLSSIDPVSNKETPFEKKLKDTALFSSASLGAVRHGMYSCVKTGSCQSLKNLPFAVGAKTGTAQWQEGKENFAWFTSFAPFNDPELVVTVLIEEGGEGGIVSAPIVRDFYLWWWNYTKQKPQTTKPIINNNIDTSV